jgi:hypothetical protein
LKYRSIKYFKCLCVLCTLCGSSAFSGESAGQAGSFLRIGLGPRAKGLGDAYTAVADNAYAPYYNPAGLAFIRSREAALSYGLLSFDRTFTYAGFVRPLPPQAGFAIGVLQSGFKDSDVRLSNGETTGEKIEDTQYTVFLGFGIRFTEKLAIGITPKLIYSKVYDVSASSVGVDFGAMYQPLPRLTLGFAVHELGQSLDYSRDASGFGNEKTKDKLPRVTKLGAAYTLPLQGTVKNLLFVSDLEMNSKQSSKLHFGIEANVMDKWFIRAGLDDVDLTAGFSIPFVVKEKNLKLEYAYILDRRSGVGYGTSDFAIAYVF